MPGLNWRQLINFWCRFINIWGYVLLTTLKEGGEEGEEILVDGQTNGRDQPKVVQAIQSLEYQTDMHRCRFDTLGKFTPVQRAGASNVQGLPPLGGTFYCS